MSFAPHQERYAASVVTSFFGVVGCALVIAFGNQVAGAALALVAAVVSWKQYQGGRARERGFEVEDKAVQALRTECAGRGWQLRTDLAFRGIGNVDAVIDTDLMTYVCEIKSYQGLMAAGNVAVRMNQARTPAWNEMQQVLRQAERIGARVVPVLWCPAARKEQIQQAGQVVLVNGKASMLCLFIVNLERSRR